MTGTLHVVGAGLAGLACAVTAARAGARVVLHEAAGHAGGRCRSFRDDTLDRVIDNGTHLLMGVNRTALAFAHAVGGAEAMQAGAPSFPFLDVASNERWTVSPNSLAARPLELLQACGLPWTPQGETVAVRLSCTKSYHRIWEPLCVAALNTAATEASARLFARLLRTALAGGTKALVPYVFPSGLSAALVAPAVATLAAHGSQLRFRHRLLAAHADRLDFDDGPVALSPDDRVVLALPPWALSPAIGDPPGLPIRAIVNAHFRLDQPAALPGGKAFLGLTGGLSQWLALRDDVLSVTVSAADTLAAETAESIGAKLWREVATILGTPKAPQPPTRIMKERRATIAHGPDHLRLRPGPHGRHPGQFLAGDWLDSPWPCTIEAAIISGLHAARLALGRPNIMFTG
jgi:hydroxysqualene dehydroxylase